MGMAIVLLFASTLANFDTKRRLLFTHVPKNGGTSIYLGVHAWLLNETARSGCAGFNYESTPPGLPGRWQGTWMPWAGSAPAGSPDDSLLYLLSNRDDGVPAVQQGSNDSCPQAVTPLCDLTLRGMGCMSAGWEHQSEEYMRASLQLCSHDGLPTVLAPGVAEVVEPVVSYAVIRDPMERLQSAWSEKLNSHQTAYGLNSTGKLADVLPNGPLIDDFNAWIQSGDFLEMALLGSVSNIDGLMNSTGGKNLCSSNGMFFDFKGVQYAKNYGGYDEDDWHYYYGDAGFADPWVVPAAALITECTVLLPMVGDMSTPSSAVMQFLDSFYPGYVMGHEDHRVEEDDEVKHEPGTIDNATQRIVQHLYAEDYRLWALVQNGSGYYPPGWRNCTARLPDGSRAVPPAARASAIGRRRGVRRASSLQASDEEGEI